MQKHISIPALWRSIAGFILGIGCAGVLNAEPSTIFQLGTQNREASRSIPWSGD